MSLISVSRCSPLCWIMFTPSRLPFAQGLVALQDLGVAENAVERRAQFMAHVGQERALGRVGRFGRSSRRRSASACLRSVRSSTKATPCLCEPSNRAAPISTGTRPPSLRMNSFSYGVHLPVASQFLTFAFVAGAVFRRQ